LSSKSDFLASSGSIASLPSFSTYIINNYRWGDFVAQWCVLGSNWHSTAIAAGVPPPISLFARGVVALRLSTIIANFLPGIIGIFKTVDEFFQGLYSAGDKAAMVTSCSDCPCSATGRNGRWEPFLYTPWYVCLNIGYDIKTTPRWTIYICTYINYTIIEIQILLLHIKVFFSLKISIEAWGGRRHGGRVARWADFLPHFAKSVRLKTKWQIYFSTWHIF
jgi:hypothetical protein